MRLVRTLALGASLLVLAGACTTGGGSKPTVRIGSVGFDEARIVAEAYAQVLEGAGYTVNRDGIGIGDRSTLQTALENSKIDLQPEYIGSSLGSKAYGGTPTGDPAANRAALQAILNGKGGGITVLDYTHAQDQNAFVVRKETADQYKLTKMSDLAAVQPPLKLGLAKDCPTNPLCAGALKSAYGLDTSGATLLDACSTPMAQALAAKTIDVAELCSTQPDIIVDGFVLLADDKLTQPADNIAPLVRNDLLGKVDKTAFQALLNGMSAKLDTATLADLYKQVSVDKKDIKVVVSTWLKAVGLVK
jgi:osmoprotectant transport system substrate-binding protein